MPCIISAYRKSLLLSMLRTSFLKVKCLATRSTVSLKIGSIKLRAKCLSAISVQRYRGRVEKTQSAKLFRGNWNCFHSPSHSSSFWRTRADQSGPLWVLVFLQMLSNEWRNSTIFEWPIISDTYTIKRLSVTLSTSFSSSDRSIHSSLLSLALRSLGGVKLWPTIVP